MSGEWLITLYCEKSVLIGITAKTRKAEMYGTEEGGRTLETTFFHSGVHEFRLNEDGLFSHVICPSDGWYRADGSKSPEGFKATFRIPEEYALFVLASDNRHQARFTSYDAGNWYLVPGEGWRSKVERVVIWF